MPPITDNLAPAVDRVLAVLRASTAPALQGVEFRFGSLPREETHAASPTVYATPADRAEVSRESFAGRGARPGAVPPQKVTWEIWVRALVDGPSPEKTQRRIEEITGACMAALQANVRLADPRTGADPLCATSRAYVQGSLVRQRGTLLEGRTIRLRLIQVVGHAEASFPDAA